MKLIGMEKQEEGKPFGPLFVFRMPSVGKCAKCGRDVEVWKLPSGAIACPVLCPECDEECGWSIGLI